IKHRHIVRLLGYCADLGGEILVCEFINNGTLYEHIHGKSEGSSTLSFQMRMKIAVEISAALEYLHSSSSTSKNKSIVHLNVNSKRILLDKNYRARLANFREAKVIPQDQTQIQGTLRGLAGYLDPENKQSKKLSTKNDVYSFGVVLVELLTSQKAFCGEKPKGQRGLAKLFARSVEEGRWDQILDGKIIKEENLETAKKVVDLAKSCLGLQNERPSMREVAMKLEVMAWDYSAAKGLAKLNFSPSPKETDELLGSPSNAQLLHVRREHDESFGRAELYDDSSLQNQIEINVELV
ncbi:wall-associated receptor kinase 1-like, partial [Prunus avium]|uniref:Wall-associated receptor kinase 1-like n=1 Tax=Prunus avium TaxID=42229 RepID=A0A6P5RAY9_PRUAV